MKIEDLRHLLGQRIVFLEAQRAAATQRGDLVEILRFETEIAETQDTLRQLGG